MIINLLLDPWMWGFVLLNVVGWFLLSWAFISIFGKTYRPSSQLRKNIGMRLVIVFTLVVGYQIFHHVEHVVQVYQYGILGLPAQEAAGILWFFDIEWNHFIFNVGYFFGLLILTFLFIKLLRKTNELHHFQNIFLIGGLIIIQGWHLIEHSVKMVRHITLGCEPCPGILDSLFGFNLIYLHFTFNTLVLLFPLTMFFWFGFHKQLWKIFTKKEIDEIPSGY